MKRGIKIDGKSKNPVYCTQPPRDEMQQRRSCLSRSALQQLSRALAWWLHTVSNALRIAGRVAGSYEEE